MNKLLYSQSTQQVYGYNRLDGEDPVGLDPDILVLTMVDVDPPEITENQSLSSTYVADVDSLEARQVWTVVDNPPAPNWPAFNGALLTNPTFVAYQQSVGHPAASAVLDAYALVAKDGVGAFTLVFNLFCQLGSVTAEHRGEWADTAASLDLPADFVEVICG